jgi:hypothetical protein
MTEMPLLVLVPHQLQLFPTLVLGNLSPTLLLDITHAE